MGRKINNSIISIVCPNIRSCGVFEKYKDIIITYYAVIEGGLSGKYTCQALEFYHQEILSRVSEKRRRALEKSAKLETILPDCLNIKSLNDRLHDVRLQS